MAVYESTTRTRFSSLNIFLWASLLACLFNSLANCSSDQHSVALSRDCHARMEQLKEQLSQVKLPHLQLSALASRGGEEVSIKITHIIHCSYCMEGHWRDSGLVLHEAFLHKSHSLGLLYVLSNLCVVL